MGEGGFYLVRLSKKNVIPHFPEGITMGDAGSPSFDMIRRSRIGVQDDEIDNFSAIPRSFWTASELRHF
jgi:hypothetical protein